MGPEQTCGSRQGGMTLDAPVLLAGLDDGDRSVQTGMCREEGEGGRTEYKCLLVCRNMYTK